MSGGDVLAYALTLAATLALAGLAVAHAARSTTKASR